MSKGGGQFVILREKNTIVMTMRGVINYDGVKSLTLSLWNHPDYDRRMNILCDLRECTYDLGLPGIAKMTSFFLTSRKTSRGHIVVVSDSPEGVANNFIVKRRVAKLFKLSSVALIESGLQQLGLNNDEYMQVFGNTATSVET